MSLPTRLTRSLLHHPAPLRPLLVSAPRHTQHAAPYHSYETQPPAPYPAAETAILSAALSHVPAHGFTHAALALGARDVGYLDATASNLFPRGPFEIVLFHRVGQRLGLGQRVQFAEGEKMGVGAKVRTLVRERLRGNEEVAGRMTEAFALSAQASNLPSSLRELARLSDEIWFLAGDSSVDSSWYTKRASLAAIYAASEVFMTQDTSPGFRDTERFLDERLEGLRRLGTGWRDVREWVGFQGVGALNVLRSKGFRV